MNPYQFLLPSINACVSMLCMQLAALLAVYEWNPTEDSLAPPIGRMLKHWFTLYFWYLLIAHQARRLWGV